MVREVSDAPTLPIHELVVERRCTLHPEAKGAAANRAFDPSRDGTLRPALLNSQELRVMFFDARKEEEGCVLQTTVCIIGGGVAGITLALEFERRGIDAVVLKSGGFKPDSETMDFYRGENVGIPYEFGDGFRSRFLGGGSNCWGGWCRPLDSHDMERRDWVPGSGWPFGIDELNPYHERAHPILYLGPVTFDIDHWGQSHQSPRRASHAIAVGAGV
jgi:hypothetical protein